MADENRQGIGNRRDQNRRLIVPMPGGGLSAALRHTATAAIDRTLRRRHSRAFGVQSGVTHVA